MKISKPKAVGYIRVSTENQGSRGSGLEEQARVIREFAVSEGYEVVMIYEDVASARGARNLDRRPGLRDTITHAQHQQLPIMVVGMDRLSREVRGFEMLVRDRALRIISITDQEQANYTSLEVSTSRAKRRGDLISQSTKDALARKKAQGVMLGNAASLPKATQISRQVRSLRSYDVVLDIADFLRSNPAHLSMKVPELVDLLNTAGLRSGWSREWTTSALRRPLAQARRELVLQDALEADVDEEFPGLNMSESPFGVTQVGAGPSSPQSNPEAISIEEEDDFDAYKNVKNFGRF